MIFDEELSQEFADALMLIEQCLDRLLAEIEAVRPAMCSCSCDALQVATEASLLELKRAIVIFDIVVEENDAQGTVGGVN